MRHLIRRARLDRAAAYALAYLDLCVREAADGYEPIGPHIQIGLLICDVNRSIRAADDGGPTIAYRTEEPRRMLRRRKEA